MSDNKYFEPILCSKCHQAIATINEAHTNKETMATCLAVKPGAGAFVYLLHDTEKSLLKIGFTGNIKQRFKQIKDNNNNIIEIIGYIHGTRTNEAILHRKFKEFRMKGEWFTHTLEIIEYFMTHPSFQNTIT